MLYCGTKILFGWCVRNVRTAGKILKTKGDCMNLEEWQTRVDSIDLGGIRLYHAYAFNETTKQVIEGDMEDTDEDFVRARFQQQLIGTLMQMDMEESMRTKEK